MTIHELITAAGLTANDEIPIWDAEASGEPTKKITGTNLAAAIKTLASLIATSDLDNTPTSGSNNAVKSGGVYTAIEQVAAFHSGDTFTISGDQVPFRSFNDKTALYFRYKLPKRIGSDVTSIAITVTSNSPTWYSGGTAGNVQANATASNISFDAFGSIRFAVQTDATPLANTGFGICELSIRVSFT